MGGGLGLAKFILILMIPLAIIHGRRFGDNPTTFHGQMRAAVFDDSLSGALIGKAGSWLMITPVSHTGGTKS